MKKSRLLYAILLTLLIPIAARAQEDLSGPVPIDPAVRTGKLENGLTYYIRYNREPEKRASFYFIQNTGAIVENDDQNGLAHFLEHMSLNGTRHFPGKGIISGLEKHGVEFGSDINAYTGYDETVYNLSNIPVERQDLIDTCLLALYDWSDYISLTDKEIDLERGVILEEYRQGRDASSRMMFDKVVPVVLKGSKYAERDIIGKPEIIKNFSYNTLRGFYNEWYRTDLEAIAVVGDINIDDTERKIKELFSKLKHESNATPRPEFDVPLHSDTRFVLATDKEAPLTTVSVITLHPSVPREKKNLQYLRDSYVTSIMNSIINTRIAELLQKGNPPMVAGSVSLDSYLPREYDAFTIVANARVNEEPLALESIYREAERARRFGFTQGELDRIKARMVASFENTWKQKDKIDNDTYASWMQENFLTGEPLTSPDFDYEFLKRVLDGISLKEVSARFSQLMTEENRTITVEGLEGNDVKHLTEQEALEIISRVKSSQLTPYADGILSQSLVPEDLKGSPVMRTVLLPRFNAVEWTLENSARVVYRKADFEKDNVIITSYRPGGTSLYETDLLPSATMLPAVISTYGTGDFDNITFQKMMAGKKATASVSLSELTEGINGSSTVKDFETAMQLLYLRFANPRFDSGAHDAIMNRYSAFISNMAKDPLKQIQDSVSLFLTSFSQRTMVMNNEMLSKVNFESVRKIYTERFGNVSGFTFIIVGNIGEDTVRAMVEKYIGSLSGGTGTGHFIDRNVRAPKGRFVKDIQIPLAVPKTTVFVSHSSGMKYTSYNNVCLKVITGILQLVFTEKVREEAGGTYGVSVNLASQLYPWQNATGLIMFECNPSRADSLKDIIYEEIDRLAKTGPGKEDLDKTVRNLLKNREESKKHNNYWSSAIYSWYYTGIDVNDPKNYEEILNKLTVKDIQKFSKAFFTKADVADIVFRPLEKK